jgi:hypothetical protein
MSSGITQLENLRPIEPVNEMGRTEESSEPHEQ